MSLRARLERETSGSRVLGAAAAPAGPSEAAERISAPSLLSRSPVLLHATPAFERRERVLGLGRRGARPQLLGACLDRLELPATSSLARDLVCLGAERGTRPAIIDLESTGLGGASMPFVVGVAWPEEGQLRVVQWVLARVGGEAEMLAAVFAELSEQGADPLVSFNGASFDVPLLRLRAARHRLAAAGLDSDHVDLLHPARRLYRGAWPDCRLGTLERELLGLRREGDIGGADIPEVFWSYVREQPKEGPLSGSSPAHARMQAVCEHNLVDLVSLPALAARLAAQLRKPDTLERARRAARHWVGQGVPGEARDLLSRWVGPSLGQRGRSPGWREAALELATLERRAAGLPRAARLWEAAWHDDPGCPAASDAWAKYLEHHAGDFGRALEVASSSRLACPHRIARLERRLARARSEIGETRRTEPGGTESGGTEPGGTESGGTESGGTESGDTGFEGRGFEGRGFEGRGFEGTGPESTGLGGTGCSAPVGSTRDSRPLAPGQPVVRQLGQGAGDSEKERPVGGVDGGSGPCRDPSRDPSWAARLAVVEGSSSLSPEARDQGEQRRSSAALSRCAAAKSSLLESVEDDAGVRLRYRLLR